MTLLYRSQQLNRTRSRYDADEAHGKKFGHPFLKPYEDGDEYRFFLPERKYGEFIVYHRYTHYQGQPYCTAHPCYCYQGGYLCPTCAPLNTTSFHDLQIPIDPERFVELTHTLKDECQMSRAQVYNWLSFWVLDVFTKRFSYDSTTPVFFQYCHYSLSDKIRTPFSFMSFLFDLLKKKTHQKKYEELKYGSKASLVIDSSNPERVRIRTLKALLKWSIEIYRKEKYIIGCETHMKHRYSVFTSASHDDHDRFRKYWKQQWDVCISQVRDEVAYRPGNIGMMCASDDFHTRVQAMDRDSS